MAWKDWDQMEYATDSLRKELKYVSNDIGNILNELKTAEKEIEALECEIVDLRKALVTATTREV